MKVLLLRMVSMCALLYGTVTGYACSCIAPGPVCSIQLGSSTIFRGTVIESTLIPNISTTKKADGTEIRLSGNGRYKVHFKVAETFSGKPETEQIVYTSQQGSMCGISFQIGREYVVFTYTHEGELLTSRCSRTALLEPGIENAAVSWMRAHVKAPSGAEIFGSVLLPKDSISRTVPATVHLTGLEERNAKTDVDGKYSFRDLSPGEYSLGIELPDGFGTYRNPSKVTVADKGCAEVDWPVTYEGRIMGRVVDSQGTPVADLRLELHRTDKAERYPEHQATTALNGNYAFEHLSPGDYLVAVRDPSFLTEEGSSTIFYPHSDRQSARAILLGAAETYNHADFTLERLRKTLSVRVKVVQKNGEAAPAGLFLFAFPNRSSGREPIRTGITDEVGIATLPLFPGWEYAISVALDRSHPQCGFVTLTTTEDTDSGTLVIQQPENCLPHGAPAF